MNEEVMNISIVDNLSGTTATRRDDLFRWFAVQGAPLETVRHAMAGSAYDLLGRYVVGHAASLLLDPSRSAVAALLRGVPVARLVPPVAPGPGIPTRFIELAQRGTLKLPDVEPTGEAPGDVPRPPRLAKGASAVAALLDERRTGR